MCNPAPGPRCAGHLGPKIKKVTKRLDAATAKGDTAAADIARGERANLRFEYHGTRTGQRELAALIARSPDQLQKVVLGEAKDQALAAYKTKRKALAAVTPKTSAPKTVKPVLVKPTPALVKPEPVKPAPAVVAKAAPTAPPISHFTSDAAFAELHRRGITSATVEFSGGNDEGGADRIIGQKADGTTVPLRAYDSVDIYEDRHTGKYLVAGRGAREATSEEITAHALAEALEAPVYANWGGFGGQFYVSGTVTWDVASGKVTEESEHEYDEDEDEDY